MSIATEITRLQNAKASIKTSIENKGVAVSSTTKLDGYPTLIDSIPTGSQITVEPLSVTQNGTYQETGKAYSPVTVNVQGGGVINNGSDVFFIDYDGSIVASYSKSNLEMPSNPSHTGLTSQGWNWTQQQITAQLTAYPNQPVYVGQMYITDDGKTRVYAHFEEGRKSPYLGLAVDGTVTIDWGDNTTSTLTGTSLTTEKNVRHYYQTGGDYTIKLTPTSGSFSIIGSSNGTHLLKKETGLQANTSRMYANAIKKVELGSNVSLGTYAFNYCMSISSITMPNGLSIGTYALRYCYSIRSITIPSSITSVPNYFSNSCTALQLISIPSGVTTLGSGAFSSCCTISSLTIPNGVTAVSNSLFSGCTSIASLVIPSGVDSIPANTFASCYGMAEYHFLATTPPSLSSTNAFSSMTSDCVIYVPYSEDHSILNAYKSASNWSTYASRMQEEPQ